MPLQFCLSLTLQYGWTDGIGFQNGGYWWQLICYVIKGHMYDMGMALSRFLYNSWVCFVIYGCPMEGRPYIFSCCSLFFFFLLFFPRLISTAADWMSAILPHMVWPQCEFKMQVWNLLHSARWKHRMQKSRQKLPSGHHRTTLSGYIFATKACIDNRKKTC